MKFVVESGTFADIDELERLYDDLNDYLSATTNYPGWIKGIYPVRENAVAGIENNTLFVVRHNSYTVAGKARLTYVGPPGNRITCIDRIVEHFHELIDRQVVR